MVNSARVVHRSATLVGLGKNAYVAGLGVAIKGYDTAKIAAPQVCTQLKAALKAIEAATDNRN